jgi:hypothetical protein
MVLGNARGYHDIFVPVHIFAFLSKSARNLRVHPSNQTQDRGILCLLFLAFYVVFRRKMAVSLAHLVPKGPVRLACSLLSLLSSFLVLIDMVRAPQAVQFPV